MISITIWNSFSAWDQKNQFNFFSIHFQFSHFVEILIMNVLNHRRKYILALLLWLHIFSMVNINVSLYMLLPYRLLIVKSLSLILSRSLNNFASLYQTLWTYEVLTLYDYDGSSFYSLKIEVKLHTWMTYNDRSHTTCMIHFFAYFYV
jgi:hypothetical protein